MSTPRCWEEIYPPPCHCFQSRHLDGQVSPSELASAGRSSQADRGYDVRAEQILGGVSRGIPTVDLFPEGNGCLMVVERLFMVKILSFLLQNKNLTMILFCLEYVSLFQLTVL